MSITPNQIDELKRMAKAEREKAIEEVERAYRAKMEAIAWMQKAARNTANSSKPSSASNEVERAEPQQVMFAEQGGETMVGKVAGVVAAINKPEFAVADIQTRLPDMNPNTLGSCIRKLIQTKVIEPVEGTGRRNRRYRIV